MSRFYLLFVYFHWNFVAIKANRFWFDYIIIVNRQYSLNDIQLVKFIGSSVAPIRIYSQCKWYINGDFMTQLMLRYFSSAHNKLCMLYSLAIVEILLPLFLVPQRYYLHITYIEITQQHHMITNNPIFQFEKFVLIFGSTEKLIMWKFLWNK